MLPEYSNHNTVAGLEQFSHIWVIFCFHLSQRQGWKPKVRPPRLGGNRALGVFATRSPFRPSPLGLSAVALDSIQFRAESIHIVCSSGDFVDGSPVLDIKPYLPYADSLPKATAGYASRPPEKKLEVLFTAAAEQSLKDWAMTHPELRELIREMLMLDPRPQYKTGADGKLYSVAIHELDIRWRVSESVVLVESIVYLPQDDDHSRVH